MRISSEEKDSILEVMTRFFPPNAKVQIFLFGSRAQDHLKGGDIDIAVVFEDKQIAKSVAEKDYHILAELKSQPAIGDQKIDLKIISTEEAKNPFFVNALSSAVRIG